VCGVCVSAAGAAHLECVLSSLVGKTLCIVLQVFQFLLLTFLLLYSDAVFPEPTHTIATPCTSLVGRRRLGLGHHRTNTPTHTIATPCTSLVGRRRLGLGLGHHRTNTPTHTIATPCTSLVGRRRLNILHDMGLDLSRNGSSETMYDEGDVNLAGNVTITDDHQCRQHNQQFHSNQYISTHCSDICCVHFSRSTF